MTDEPVPRPGAPGRTRRVVRVLAIALFVLALAGCAAAVMAALAGSMSFGAAVSAYTVTDGAMALAFPVCGMLLAWYRPRNPIGWLFLAAGLGMASTAVTGTLLNLGAQRGWSQVALRVLSTVGSYGWPWSIALFLPLALILFPDGRLPGRRWRWLVWATVADTLPFIASLGSPNPQLIGHRRVSIYLAPPRYHQLGLLWMVANLLWAVIFAGAVASLAVRYRRGSETERRQLLWLLLVGLILVPWVGVIWGVFNSGPILGLLALSLAPELPCDPGGLADQLEGPAAGRGRPSGLVPGRAIRHRARPRAFRRRRPRRPAARHLPGTPGPGGRPDRRAVPGIGGVATYTEDILVGYRFFAEHNQRPLFPFGHGLSFARFGYENLRIARQGDDEIRLTFAVVNDSPRPGDEVAQLYLRCPEEAAEPPLQLKGFRRMHLRAGERRDVTFTLTSTDLAAWHDHGGWTVHSGRYQVLIGASSADVRLSEFIDVLGDHRETVS